MKLSAKYLRIGVYFTSLLFIVFLFLYKLDYEYFFTDEILYFNSGKEYLRGEFSLNLQAPFIGKYIAGITSLFTERNLFIIRLPFAILGIASAYTVYVIISSEYGKKWGLFAAIIFSSSPFILSATKTAMLESPMHFFWLVSHLFLLKYLKDGKYQNLFVFSVFVGLGLATKVPSILFLAFFPFISIITKLKNNTQFDLVKFLKEQMILYTVSFGVYAVTYFPMFIKHGINSFIDIARVTKDTYVQRNLEGKLDVIDGSIYKKSPWWFYLYEIKNRYAASQIFVYITLVTGSIYLYLKKKDFFALYWFIFFVLDVVFFQLMTLKNGRYVSSMEIPLVFFSIYGVRYVYNKFLSNKLGILFLSTIFLLFILPTVFKLLNQDYSKYLALEKYLIKETKNFTSGDRTFIVGSVRSSRWHFAPYPENQVINRKEYHIFSREFPQFKYLVFDPEELLKDPSNALYSYLIQNRNGYIYTDIGGLDTYIKKNEFSLTPNDKYADIFENLKNLTANFSNSKKIYIAGYGYGQVWLQNQIPDTNFVKATSEDDLEEKMKSINYVVLDDEYINLFPDNLDINFLKSISGKHYIQKEGYKIYTVL